ncbi:MAG: hypothetical protein JWM37_904 [Candidatus Saccharibacteria bacterium]|nr:hypothetical protein [Candidatus Saccharibacteria bacterium]
MQKLFTASFFAGNRTRLRAGLKAHELIVVTANGLLQRSADSSFPFQQDSSFWYLTGIDEPDVTLVMSPAGDFLIIPGRSASRQAFDGVPEYAQLSKISGIDEVMDEQAGWERLMRYLRKAKRVAMPLPADAYIQQYGLYANPARRRLMQRCRRVAPNIEIHDIRPDIGRLRMVKQSAELKAIQQAIDVTVDTLQTVIGQIDSYKYEYEVEADITRGFRRGARGHAFEPIVAAGANACTLHNVANADALPNNALLTMDVGAEVSHYAADITRTIAIGTPTDRQQAVFDAVLEVQEAAKKLLKPGVMLREYEQQVEQLIGKQLNKLGVIKTMERADIRRYYPHATTHFLGLDVHDVGDYQMPLQPGLVLTVEPGIYIPEEGIGVRIEDDVVVTKTGIKVLSAALPRVLQ